MRHVARRERASASVVAGSEALSGEGKRTIARPLSTVNGMLNPSPRTIYFDGRPLGARDTFPSLHLNPKGGFMLKEFKEFALKGSVLDLAIGVIIGGAFGTVVKSLVDDILMPPLGRLIGNIDFSNLFVNLGAGQFDSLAAAKEAGAATINYGMFINNVISFLIIAFAVFMLVKWFNKLRRQPEVAKAPDVKECPHCISAISVRATRCPNCTSEIG
jgi:large conductance mechanosensitive channel